MNLIVIVADSCRADPLGCYGGAVRTPNLDDLASDSALLEQAYSENMPTLPCRAAWWTGRHLFPLRGWQPFEADDLLMAEMLSSRGYTSALITDTYHMHRPGYNCGRGFDTTCFVRGQEYDPWITPAQATVSLGDRHRLRGDDSDATWQPRFEQYLRNATAFQTEQDHCAPRVFTEAVRWLEHASAHRKDRLFLWIDSFSPHEPWDPPEPYRSMYDPEFTGQEIIDPVPGPVRGYMTNEEVRHTRSLYEGVITLVDKWIGVLLDALRSLDLYENSVVMFTSDHGEPFGEHGIIRKARPWCHEELARIPWLVRLPDGTGRGRRFRGFAQPPDLLPTALAALGEPLHGAPFGWAFGAEPDLPAFTGCNLLPMLAGEIDEVRDTAVSAFHGKQWSVRSRDWTYLLPLEPDCEPELYDRRNDPGEQANVCTEHPDVAEHMELQLRRLADRAARTGGKAR